ncbi:hypothetical protein H072_911 [Dactylellina haptotyla CBS 200.50]|uniref:Uncharacterized protein n=1 Tax=Dactylellina haptotyla (strain CBS 200.50) TaxID=1284197 RepID=S8CBQ7_DACHA|nr:hypothetical protein H072_911 [Dactylellina haptotyla CBS 200.50]
MKRHCGSEPSSPGSSGKREAIENLGRPTVAPSSEGPSEQFDLEGEMNEEFANVAGVELSEDVQRRKKAVPKSRQRGSRKPISASAEGSGYPAGGSGQFQEGGLTASASLTGGSSMATANLSVASSTTRKQAPSSGSLGPTQSADAGQTSIMGIIASIEAGEVNSGVQYRAAASAHSEPKAATEPYRGGGDRSYLAPGSSTIAPDYSVIPRPSTPITAGSATHQSAQPASRFIGPSAGRPSSAELTYGFVTAGPSVQAPTPVRPPRAYQYRGAALPEPAPIAPAADDEETSFLSFGESSTAKARNGFGEVGSAAPAIAPWRPGAQDFLPRTPSPKGKGKERADEPRTPPPRSPRTPPPAPKATVPAKPTSKVQNLELRGSTATARKLFTDLPKEPKVPV